MSDQDNGNRISNIVTRLIGSNIRILRDAIKDVGNGSVFILVDGDVVKDMPMMIDQINPHGQITLNISPTACRNWTIDGPVMEFDFRMAGVDHRAKVFFDQIKMIWSPEMEIGFRPTVVSGAHLATGQILEFEAIGYGLPPEEQVVPKVLPGNVVAGRFGRKAP